MNVQTLVFTGFLYAFLGSEAYADRTDLPEALYEHGLTSEAKLEFIKITLDRKAGDDEKAKSFARLGDIAFEEKKLTLALKTWKNLIELFPKSEEAILTNERIRQLGQIVETTSDETSDNTLANLYIRHGDWWSKGKDEGITIDTSWIPRDKVAIEWYNRTIANFPQSDAAIVAAKKKFSTIYGWQESGKYGETYGVKSGNPVEDLIVAFDEIALMSPEDRDLQRLRYIIAQAYWEKRNFPETRAWLQKIIDNAEAPDGFYENLARWRLTKIEY